MATIIQTSDGTYRVRIRRQGYPPISRNFTKKALAQRWATQTEFEIDRGTFNWEGEAQNIAVSELIDRYLAEIAPTKKSFADIKSRCLLLRENFGDYSILSLTPAVIKAYRDRRLLIRHPDSVRKEILLLGRILTAAEREWDFVFPKTNPVKRLAIPRKGRGRDRRLLPGEERILIEEAQRYGGFIADVIQFAIETGMRRGEIVRLQWRDVDINRRVATLRDTKNSFDRDVPLSSQAMDILERQKKDRSGRVFSICADSITTAFTRITDRAGLHDLRFHDLRHEAASRFFERGFSVMEVSSITGHRDLASLKRYTHLRAEDLAKKLA